MPKINAPDKKWKVGFLGLSLRGNVRWIFIFVLIMDVVYMIWIKRSNYYHFLKYVNQSSKMQSASLDIFLSSFYGPNLRFRHISFTSNIKPFPLSFRSPLTPSIDNNRQSYLAYNYKTWANMHPEHTDYHMVYLRVNGCYFWFNVFQIALTVALISLLIVAQYELAAFLEIFIAFLVALDL